MSARAGRLALFVPLALTLPLLLCGQPRDATQGALPQKGKGMRLDHRGDPLPEGALTRLGSANFRHRGRVVTAALSPDARRLAVASTEHRGPALHLWDTAAGKELWVCRDFEVLSALAQVSFSPDGKLLAASDYRALHLWDVGSGKKLDSLPAHPDRFARFAFSPDSRLLAAAGGSLPAGIDSDYSIHLWDLASGRRRCSLKGAGEVFSLAFSPDGKTLVAGGASSRVKAAGAVALWDTATLKERLPPTSAAERKRQESAR
jgi:WD40 repeat protein